VLEHGATRGFAGAGLQDLGLAVDLARVTGAEAPVSAAVEQVYRQARARYGDAGVRCSRSSSSKT
jgi:3-hydroxyisobutyrate dehydrogenase